MHKEKENNRLEKDVATFEFRSGTLFLRGRWTWSTVPRDLLKELPNETALNAIDGSEIRELDSTGAYFISQVERQLSLIGAVSLVPKQQILLDLVRNNNHSSNKPAQPHRQFEMAYQIGIKTSRYVRDFVSFVGFLGQLGQSLFETAKAPWKVRWYLILDVAYSAGYQAIGIICLLCFLIGVVLAYQLGPQLATYGANIFVVDLLGIALLREFSPLIAAIIVAGRSGAAFAAQIGTMKVQEEIDALQTFGLSPIRRLVLPRITGLVIVLPLLVVLADISSVLGGMLMSKVVLGLGFTEFITQFGNSVSLKHYLAGMIKTPVFACIIAAVGCYRGLRVKGDANSIGEETTRSVVLAIFFIIITDALFSIIFSTVGF